MSNLLKQLLNKITGVGTAHAPDYKGQKLSPSLPLASSPTVAQPAIVPVPVTNANTPQQPKQIVLNDPITNTNREKWLPDIHKSASENKIDPLFWDTLAFAESSYNPSASTKGSSAKGFMGLNDTSIKELQRKNPKLQVGDLSDPQNLLRLSAEYYKTVVAPRSNTKDPVDVYRHWVMPYAPDKVDPAYLVNFNNKHAVLQKAYE